MPPKVKNKRKKLQKVCVSKLEEDNSDDQEDEVALNGTDDDGDASTSSLSFASENFINSKAASLAAKNSFALSKQKRCKKKEKASIGKKLDINTCTISALKKTGVPHAVAQKIVRYRKKHKCFVHINELLRVQGVKGELFTLLAKLVFVGSNAEELNTLLRSRKPANSKSNVKANKGKSKISSRTQKSKLPNKSGPRKSKSANSIVGVERDNPHSSGLSERWPRGSASLSSVLTISPRIHRSRSQNRDRDEYPRSSSRGHRMIKYDERIPEGRSRSPFRYRDERLYSEFLKSRRNAKFNPQGYGESSQSGYPSHPEPTALSVEKVAAATKVDQEISCIIL